MADARDRHSPARSAATKQIVEHRLMAGPKQILIGNEEAGVRVQYVESGRRLRLSGWHAGGAPIEPMELSIEEFCSQLGITHLGAEPPHLIFAGRSHDRDMVAAFDTETQARDAFRRMRLQSDPGYEWAELVTLTRGLRFRVICWFGGGEQAAEPNCAGGSPAAESGEHAPAPQPARGRGWKRQRGEAGRGR